MNAKVISLMVCLLALMITQCLCTEDDVPMDQHMDAFAAKVNGSTCFGDNHKVSENANYYSCVRVCYRGKYGQVCYNKCH